MVNHDKRSLLTWHVCTEVLLFKRQVLLIPVIILYVEPDPGHLLQRNDALHFT